MTTIPYGKQSIDESDIQAVADVLRSDRITQGHKIAEFEEALAKYCGARYTVVLSNGTAALQAAYFAAGLKAGDEIVTTPITFAATATAALWLGARPVFADIDPKTGNLDPEAAKRAVTSKTKVLAPVDLAGWPADPAAFAQIAKSRGLLLVEDACHAFGAVYKGKKIGAWSDMSVFSFHPVKSITTGEGGAVLTNDKRIYDRLLKFRAHGIAKGEDWEYAVEEMGLNYRLTDFQCALGLSQLKKLDGFIKRRSDIAERYNLAFKNWEETEVVEPAADSKPIWHLYILRLRGAAISKRREIFQALHRKGIGAQVHYIPVYWHPLYQKLGYSRGLCPKAEAFYERIVSLPIYPTLTEPEQNRVIETLRGVLDELYANRHTS